jgi:plastocyanin
MNTTKLRTATAGLLALGLAFGAVACGDDDDGDAAGEAVLSAEVCDAAMQFGGVFTMAPEDPAEFAPFATETVLPLLEQVKAGVTDAAAEHVATLETIYQGIGETGDPSALESVEYAEASEAVGALVHDDCGAEQVAVEGVDYAFEGAPDELDAGLTSIRFTNGGSEEHEMVLFRRADGAEESLDELLALPEEESMAKVEMRGVTFAPPGGAGYVAADLQPGTYFLVCFIPVGGGEEGEPHFAHGMKHTITVS